MSLYIRIVAGCIMVFILIAHWLYKNKREPCCPDNYELKGGFCFEQCAPGDEEFGPWCKIAENTINVKTELNRAHPRSINTPGLLCDNGRIPYAGHCYDLCREGYEFGDNPSVCRQICPNGYIKQNRNICHRPAAMYDKKIISAK